jgi:outer membrane protein assembly factor BamB
MAVDKLCCGTHNRGVAIGYGRLYMITADARLVALDAATGKIVWDMPVVDPTTGNPADLEDLKALKAVDASKPDSAAQLNQLTRFAGNMAPVVYDGKVFVGVSGTGYSAVLGDAESANPSVLGRVGTRPGQRAFLSAYAATSGQLVWRWYATAAQGWEGEFAERTSFGDTLERDLAAERANADKFSDAWKAGGGSIYSSPSIDPELGLIYFGTGNASPGYADHKRPGDNLYTASLIALDVKTGKLRWYHQIVPHDIWGYDVANPPVLFDFLSNGTTVRAVAEASKSGWVYVLDRATGKALRRSEAFVPHNNLIFHRPTPGGIIIAPGAGGGANWPPTSYSPQTGWLYVSGTHNPTRYHLDSDHLESGEADQPANIVLSFVEGGEIWGTLSAIDPNDGHIKWQEKTDLPLRCAAVLANRCVNALRRAPASGVSGGQRTSSPSKSSARMIPASCGRISRGKSESTAQKNRSHQAR